MTFKMCSALLALVFAGPLAADVVKYELTGTQGSWFGIPSKSAELTTALVGADTFVATIEIDEGAAISAFTTTGTIYNSALISLDIELLNGETVGVNVVTPGRIGLTNSTSHIVSGELNESSYSYNGTLSNLTFNGIVNVQYRFQDNSASIFNTPPPNAIPDLDGYPGVKYFEVIFVGEGNTNYVRFNINSISRVNIVPPVVCEGFQPPMASYPVKAKKNRVFPLKLELFDSAYFEITGNDLVSMPVIQVLFTPQNGGAAIDVSDDVLPSGQGSEGNQLSWTDDGIWQFNLKSKNYTAKGEYLVLAVSGDESEYTIDPTCVTSFVIE